MGQGTYTSIPMLIAKSWRWICHRCRLDTLRPNEKLYGNPLLGGVQATGIQTRCARRGSLCVKPVRSRETMLVSAAARRWNADPASCRAQSGQVLHAPTGRSLKYGELAADAPACLSRARGAQATGGFQLIGTPAKRLDTPAKVNGTAVYGHRC